VELDLAKEPYVRLCHQDHMPLGFWISTSPTGNRFDPMVAPLASTEVLYGGSILETAIAETLLRWHGDVEPGEAISFSEKGHFVPRRVVTFRAKRKLKVIDATGAGMRRIQEVIAAMPPQNPPAVAEGIFDCHVDEYPQTHQWATWFRTQLPEADGLRWSSRQFNRGQCMVLFKDRCADQLEAVGKPAPLMKARSRSRKLVKQMLGEFGFGLDP